LIILALPFLIVVAIVVSFIALSRERSRRNERRARLAWIDKREVHQQRVADVVNITGWRTFRQRRAQGELS
jgi:hypothetical protein